MPDEPFDLHALLTALDRAGVRYVLIGGLAMVAHGASYVTQDIDLTYSRDTNNLKALTDALRPLEPHLRGVDPQLPFLFDPHTLRNVLNLTLDTSVGALDLMGDVPGVLSFEDIYRRAVRIELYGISVPVASLEDLIAMKRAADRPKDRLHLLELEALRRLSADG